jgi:hypothetical protein
MRSIFEFFAALGVDSIFLLSLSACSSNDRYGQSEGGQSDALIQDGAMIPESSDGSAEDHRLTTSSPDAPTQDGMMTTDAVGHDGHEPDVNVESSASEASSGGGTCVGMDLGLGLAPFACSACLASNNCCFRRVLLASTF